MRRMSMTLTMAVALGALAFPAAASAAVRVDAAASVSAACPDVAHYENAARDGHNCSTVPPGAGQMWSTTLNAPASYPVIAGGRVFVTTSSPGRLVRG
jgi:ABC-type molybdate transport system substrate-binding protein